MQDDNFLAGVPFQLPSPSFLLFTDASLDWLGSTCAGAEGNCGVVGTRSECVHRSHGYGDNIHGPPITPSEEHWLGIGPNDRQSHNGSASQQTGGGGTVRSPIAREFGGYKGSC